MYDVFYICSTFVMDDWKKMYSNNDTKTVALPWFWENFDPENYSVWYAEYKYPQDLALVFMSSNLIGGRHWILFSFVRYL